MVQFLIARFIKNKDDVKNPKVRQQYGTLCSLVGIVLNIFLFAGKYVAGLLSNSIAIMADSFNNLSDAGSSIITLIGFRLAGKKPDPGHPFGHGRVEYLSGLVVSAMILIMGVELGRTSIEKILHPQPVDTSILSMAILAAAILVKVYMAAYNRRIGAKIDSAAMKATAADSLSDTVATAVVLISMIIMRFTSLNLDGIGGVFVALFILRAGIGAMKDTLSPLLGQAPDPEFVEQIRDIVMANPVSKGIHDLVVHDYGPGRVMISLHVEVSGDDDIYEIHDAIDCIERDLTEKLGCEAVIHMDPIAVNDEAVMAMRSKVEEEMRGLDSNVTIHDFRMVAGPTHTNLIFDIVVPHSVDMTQREIDSWVKQRVAERFERCFAVIQIDRPYVS